MFLRSAGGGGRKPLEIVSIHALPGQGGPGRVLKYGDEIEVSKFGGVKHLGDLAYLLRPLRTTKLCQGFVFGKGREQELEHETTGEKKSGFVVQDGPWPGDAKPNPKWLFVVAEEPV